MASEELTLGSVFASAFLSSTLLPGGSEIVLVAVDMQRQFDPWLLVAVATAGNTLGGMTSWLIGRWIRWRYPVGGLRHARQIQALDTIRKWGSPALFLSWVPIIGDPLCVAAGWLRVQGWIAFAWIGLGKLVRYAFLVALV